MDVKHHVYFRKPITTEDVDAHKLNTEIQNCEEQRSKSQSFFTPNFCYLHGYISEGRGPNTPCPHSKDERKKQAVWKIVSHRERQLAAVQVSAATATATTTTARQPRYITAAEEEDCCNHDRVILPIVCRLLRYVFVRRQEMGLALR